MNYTAALNDLEINKDIKMISHGSPREYFNYLKEHENKTMIGVLFCTSEYVLYEDMGISIPCKFDEIQGRKLIFYTVVYNWTLNFKSPYLSD